MTPEQRFRRAQLEPRPKIWKHNQGGGWIVVTPQEAHRYPTWKEAVRSALRWHWWYHVGRWRVDG